MYGTPAPPPNDTPTLEHGGEPPAGIRLDLSTGINPHAYPLEHSDAAFRQLPTRQQLDRLMFAARAAYGVPESSSLVAAPGTQAILQWLPFLVSAPKEIRVLSPTYGEHVAIWSRFAPTVPVDSLSALAEAPVAVLVNPNNPTGARLAAGEVAGFAKAHAERHPNGLLVVDEAFVDVDPPLSVSGLGLPRTVVLRSFGKFYGLAGVRLGFAIAEPWLGDRLRQALGPWAVSTPAIEAATAALSDGAWRDAMRYKLRDEAAELDALLIEAGFGIVGGTALFRLVHHPDSPRWHARLAAENVWTRRFTAHPHWLRFGLPGENLPVLRAALAAAR